MAHIHAELMAQYAADAMETDEPWERWQIQRIDHSWSTLDDHPCWHHWVKYRRKPKKKIMRAWVNLYPSYCSGPYHNKDDADIGKGIGRLECREITWEVEE